MSSERPDAEEPAATDTREAIMEATYSALCEHGYADLTMQDIADESTISKAALHYHFDTKEGLLLAFLDHLYEGFAETYATVEGDDAVERLVAFVDDILCREDSEEVEALHTALLEVRAQAPYADPYRERLRRFDAFVRDRVETIVAEGIEEGTIRSDVNPADTAAFVTTLVDGVNARRVAIGDTGDGARRTFLSYVRDHLAAPGADVSVADGERSTDAGGAGEASGGAADGNGSDGGTR